MLKTTLTSEQEGALSDYLRLASELTEALEAKYDLEKRINTLRHQFKFREQVLRDLDFYPVDPTG